MARGAEAYLQMWERADGVPADLAACQSRVTFSRRGLARMRSATSVEALLRRAGQPSRRPGRAWSYCSGRGNGGTVTPVLSPAGRLEMVLSAARFHKAAGIGPRARASRLRRARKVASGVYTRPAGGGAQFVWLVKRGRVTHAGVASRVAAKNARTLKSYVKASGL